MRKNTISGDKPLWESSEILTAAAEIDAITYVRVSWVFMQVLMSSTPVLQSRCPSLVISLDFGGTDTSSISDLAVVAPSINEPPRKHTR